MAMSAAASRAGIEPATSEPDLVIEAYKKDVDRTLFDSTLVLTVEERLRDLMRLQRFAEELERAGRQAFEPPFVDEEYAAYYRPVHPHLPAAQPREDGATKGS